MAHADELLGWFETHSVDDIRAALELWFEHRHEIDRVRNFGGTHVAPHYNNAAYYWMFGHYYAIKVAHRIGGKIEKKTNRLVLNAIMADQEKNGTWLGHTAFGDICGTAQALMIFGALEGGFHSYRPRMKPRRREF